MSHVYSIRQHYATGAEAERTASRMEGILQAWQKRVTSRGAMENLAMLGACSIALQKMAQALPGFSGPKQIVVINDAEVTLEELAPTDIFEPPAVVEEADTRGYRTVTYDLGTYGMVVLGVHPRAQSHKSTLTVEYANRGVPMEYFRLLCDDLERTIAGENIPEHDHRLN